MSSSEIIDSIFQISPQALGELRQWLQTQQTGGIGGSGGAGLNVMSITAAGGDSIADSTYTPIGFPAAYDFNTNSSAWPTRSGSGSGVGTLLAGYYEVTGWADLDPAGGAGNQRILRLRVNGTTLLNGYTRSEPFGDPNDMLTTAVVALASSDYVELLVFQDSGVDLTVNAAWLQWKYLHS